MSSNTSSTNSEEETLIDYAIDVAVNLANTLSQQIEKVCAQCVTVLHNVQMHEVNVFAWKMMGDALPTRWNLSQRGMELNTLICPICGEAVEHMEHLFFTCSFARAVMEKVLRWWGLPAYSIDSLPAWKAWLKDVRYRKSLKHVLEGVFFVTWWAIWKFRNQTLFGCVLPPKVLALYTNHLCYGNLCFENERLALLQFKHDLIDDGNRLSSWNSRNTDCCQWAGIVCDNITGHVQELHLQGPDPDLEEAFTERLSGSINPSLLSLKQLEYLDLSCNDFQAIQIPSFIGSLTQLRYLNLSLSNFQGDVPHQLGNLSNLVVLDLKFGVWLSDVAVKRLNWLSGLPLLTYLDMSGYDLHIASEWLQVVHTLPALEELHLSSCNLSQIPRHPTVVNFTSLTILDLSYNFFDSLMPEWIFSLDKLVSLDLSRCLFHGTPVPGTVTGFNNLTSLKFLHVTENQYMNSPSVLKGLLTLKSLVSFDLSTCGISTPILGSLENMTSLISIDLSQNHIAETLPNSIGNLCNLTRIDLRSNNFSGSVSGLLANLCECKSPKLDYLAFSSNELSGRIPDKIGNLRHLVTFDLAYNTISGIIPYSFGRLSFLRELMLNVNSLSGPLPDSFALKKLWADANTLTLEIGVDNWVPPFQLNVLRLGSWNLGPRFPSWIQSQGNLTDLDISKAGISDIMPDWFWSSFSDIVFLNMSQNSIRGELKGDLSIFAPNAIVDLSENNFEGPLPGNFSDADFDVLDASNNNLSGSLEQFLCPSLEKDRPLQVLDLARNNLSGVIPDCWMNWHALSVVNFENNKFSGTIPESVGNLSSLLSFNIRNNKLSGKIPPSLLNSESLQIIELAKNELTGTIPVLIKHKETNLKLLSLRSNKLEGEIPDEICRLKLIQILDLAHNNLSGTLPTCFRNFTIMSGKESSSPIILYDEFVQNQVLGSASLVTKGREFEYSTILYLVTTLDLSGNNFSGPIPRELVGLVGLRWLNLSGNHLTGRIPDEIGEMRSLESLDLSMNRLDGRIPWSMSRLTTLNWLNLSSNKLSGVIPTSTQLQSLNESSFKGNELCGPPLTAVCDRNRASPDGSTRGGEEEEEDDESDGEKWGFIISIVVGFIIGFWVVVAPLIASKDLRDGNTDFRWSHMISNHT
ncbi:hypothetical protein LXL04_012095 [Taraxacum kok-saghyz]